MWSIGALLELEDRSKLEIFMREQFEMNFPETDPQQTMFEFFVDDAGEWEHWESRVEEYIYPKAHTPDYLSILVPNVDNVRTDFLIKTIAKQGKVICQSKVLLAGR